jgi:hypothetical protein
MQLKISHLTKTTKDQLVECSCSEKWINRIIWVWKNPPDGYLKKIPEKISNNRKIKWGPIKLRAIII